MMRSSRARLALAAVSLAAVPVAACGGGDGGAAPPASASAAGRPAPAALAVVDTATVTVPLSLPGELYVEHDAVVLARAPGLVERVTADLGTRVAAGQLLAKLESTDQEIALARATEEADNARRVAERQRALAKMGGATAAELEQVEYNLRRAIIQLRQADRDAGLTRVVAPFAGVVTARMARARQIVAVGDSLFRVTAASPLLVSVRVPESAVGGIRVGASAHVSGLRGSSSSARVVRASPALDPGSGTRQVVLQLDNAARLMPGSSVTVELGAERRQVVTMPKSAVAEEGYVLVWADDRTTLRAVTLGADLGGGRVEVVSGLAPGETVVRSGQ